MKDFEIRIPKSKERKYNLPNSEFLTDEELRNLFKMAKRASTKN